MASILKIPSRVPFPGSSREWRGSQEWGECSVEKAEQFISTLAWLCSKEGKLHCLLGKETEEASSNSRTWHEAKFMCKCCQVYSCITADHNCFEDYHTLVHCAVWSLQVLVLVFFSLHYILCICVVVGTQCYCFHTMCMFICIMPSMQICTVLFFPQTFSFYSPVTTPRQLTISLIS